MMRRGVLRGLAGCMLAAAMPVAAPARAATGAGDGADVIANWYRLVLELVRHTPTYSPPVASRAFSYMGVIAYEAVASGRADMVSFAGQLTDLEPPPPRDAGAVYDEAVVLNAALTDAVGVFFANTGPTGQRAKAAMAKSLTAQAVKAVQPDVARRSAAYGRALANHIIAWSQTDGGAEVENMGFPYDYTRAEGPEKWVPTSLIVQQQNPLLPDWGRVRPFAMPAGDACALPPPPAYSEDPASAFYAEAQEVHDVTAALTPDQKLIARFWSDDPMLSPTPPGHWTAIAMDILDAQNADAARRAEVLARLGIAVADAFIGCWQTKYAYNLLRPVTYIRRVIDPKWEPLLITPPFPEYPSGHSTQSGAAAAVLTDLFGEDFAFEDATHEDEGMPARPYPSFDAAAKEAALSRLYGGIHFRSAIVRGLEQGRCIGAHTNALRTWK